MTKTPMADFIQALIGAGADVHVVLVAVRGLELGQATGQKAGQALVDDDEKRKTARERKRLWRKSKKGQVQNVPPDVSVVPVGQEPVFGKNDLLTIEPVSKIVSEKEEKKEVKVSARGTRLPADFIPNAACELVARELKLNRGQWQMALAEFRDYWDAVPGVRGTKLDWHGTFRNNLRRKGQIKNGYQSAKQQHATAAREALDEQYKFIAGTGEGDFSNTGLQDGSFVDLTRTGENDFGEG